LYWPIFSSHLFRYINTLLCIGYIIYSSWLQILELSTAITLQSINGIIQDSS
jgi:hypothetical protein